MVARQTGVYRVGLFRVVVVVVTEHLCVVFEGLYTAWG